MLSLSVDELRKKYLEAEAPGEIIFWGYVYQEKKCFALDYNDLINFVLYIIGSSEEIRGKWQERLEYIMTRVARLDEEMWTELMMDNSDYLADQLGILIGHLAEYLEALRAGDTAGLLALLKDGREKKTTAGGD